MALVIKYRGTRGYYYEQHSYREGKRVRTKSTYIGPIEPYHIEPGEVQADKFMTQWVEQGGPQRVEQEKAEKAEAWTPEKFLADTAGSEATPAAEGEASDKDSNSGEPQ